MNFSYYPRFRKNIDLLKTFVWTDFKLRYEGSVLGYFWTLVKPLLLFGVLYVVFSVFMRFPVEHYQLYLLLGIILWNFFTESTSIGMSSFIAKRSIITKVYFPRYILVLASTLTAFLTLLLNLVIFFIFVWVSPISFHLSMLFFPVYLIELYFIALGVTFFLSVLFVFFRDLLHIWEVLLQIGFWTVPIIYPISIIPEKYHRFIFFNPLARIITYSRALFIENSIPSFQLNAVLFLMTIFIFFIGFFVFRSRESSITEML